MKYISLIIGILLFIGFGWTMEHQRDFSAWFLLLISILNLLAFAIDEVTDKIKKHIDDKK